MSTCCVQKGIRTQKSDNEGQMSVGEKGVELKENRWSRERNGVAGLKLKEGSRSLWEEEKEGDKAASE